MDTQFLINAINSFSVFCLSISLYASIQEIDKLKKKVKRLEDMNQ